MGYVRAGQLVTCRNIVFKDTKNADLEEFHPGIVLFPVDDGEKELFALYMTSSKTLAKKRKSRYIEIINDSKRNSFVNVYQIEKVKNSFGNLLNADDYFKDISFEEYAKALRKFYNYQTNPMVEQDENFLEIKTKLELMLAFIKFQEKANSFIDPERILDITPRNIEVLEGLPEKDLEKFILVNICGRCNTKSEQEDVLNTVELPENEKEDILKLTQNAKRIIACNDEQVEEVVEKLVDTVKTPIELIGVENFLRSLAIAIKMSDNNEKRIEKFTQECEKQINNKRKIQIEKEEQINMEKCKAQLKRQKAIEKSEINRARKAEKTQKQMYSKKLKKKKKLIEKYGNFDGFDF